MKTSFPLLVFALIACVVASGCSDEVEDVAEGEATPGETKTLSGEVIAVIDARTFTMKDEHQWLEDNPLTVVATTDLPEGLDDEDEVAVVGSVRNLEYAEIETEYDWDFDPEIEVELEDVEGFFIADSVVVTEQEPAG